MKFQELTLGQALILVKSGRTVIFAGDSGEGTVGTITPAQYEALGNDPRRLEELDGEELKPYSTRSLKLAPEKA